MKFGTVDPRYSFPKETRKIGGKVYEFLHREYTKADAEKEGKRWKEKGNIVRIAKVSGGWGIYLKR